MMSTKVNIVTAPEHRYIRPNSISVFLAGGICKCVEWQKQIIDHFNKDTFNLKRTDNIYIFNPRREDWVDGPDATERQIEWEFDMLEKCDIFSMYFAGGESDQPICMYELGRNLVRMMYEYPDSWMHRIVITCDASYKRLNDVIIQTRLATNDLVKVNVVDDEKKSIKIHYEKINEKIIELYE